MVYPSIWDHDRFEGILRSFRIDGIAAYPVNFPPSSSCIQKINYEDSCNPTICQNGGLCQLGTPPSCSCQSPFTGEFCQISKF